MSATCHAVPILLLLPLLLVLLPTGSLLIPPLGAATSESAQPQAAAGVDRASSHGWARAAAHLTGFLLSRSSWPCNRARVVVPQHGGRRRPAQTSDSGGKGPCSDMGTTPTVHVLKAAGDSAKAASRQLSAGASGGNGVGGRGLAGAGAGRRQLQEAGDGLPSRDWTMSSLGSWPWQQYRSPVCSCARSRGSAGCADATRLICRLAPTGKICEALQSPARDDVLVLPYIQRICAQQSSPQVGPGNATAASLTDDDGLQPASHISSRPSASAADASNGTAQQQQQSYAAAQQGQTGSQQMQQGATADGSSNPTSYPPCICAYLGLGSGECRSAVREVCSGGTGAGGPVTTSGEEIAQSSNSSNSSNSSSSSGSGNAAPALSDALRSGLRRRRWRRLLAAAAGGGLGGDRGVDDLGGETSGGVICSLAAAFQVGNVSSLLTGTALRAVYRQLRDACFPDAVTAPSYCNCAVDPFSANCALSLTSLCSAGDPLCRLTLEAWEGQGRATAVLRTFFSNTCAGGQGPDPDSSGLAPAARAVGAPQGVGAAGRGGNASSTGAVVVRLELPGVNRTAFQDRYGAPLMSLLASAAGVPVSAVAVGSAMELPGAPATNTHAAATGTTTATTTVPMAVKAPALGPAAASTTAETGTKPGLAAPSGDIAGQSVHADAGGAVILSGGLFGSGGAMVQETSTAGQIGLVRPQEAAAAAVGSDNGDLRGEGAPRDGAVQGGSLVGRRRLVQQVYGSQEVTQPAVLPGVAAPVPVPAPVTVPVSVDVPRIRSLLVTFTIAADQPLVTEQRLLRELANVSWLPRLQVQLGLPYAVASFTTETYNEKGATGNYDAGAANVDLPSGVGGTSGAALPGGPPPPQQTGLLPAGRPGTDEAGGTQPGGTTAGAAGGGRDSSSGSGASTTPEGSLRTDTGTESGTRRESPLTGGDKQYPSSSIGGDVNGVGGGISQADGGGGTAPAASDLTQRIVVPVVAAITGAALCTAAAAAAIVFLRRRRQRRGAFVVVPASAAKHSRSGGEPPPTPHHEEALTASPSRVVFLGTSRKGAGAGPGALSIAVAASGRRGDGPQASAPHSSEVASLPTQGGLHCSTGGLGVPGEGKHSEANLVGRAADGIRGNCGGGGGFTFPSLTPKAADADTAAMQPRSAMDEASSLAGLTASARPGGGGLGPHGSIRNVSTAAVEAPPEAAAGPVQRSSTVPSSSCRHIEPNDNNAESSAAMEPPPPPQAAPDSPVLGLHPRSTPPAPAPAVTCGLPRAPPGLVGPTRSSALGSLAICLPRWDSGLSGTTNVSPSALSHVAQMSPSCNVFEGAGTMDAGSAGEP